MKLLVMERFTSIAYRLHSEVPQLPRFDVKSFSIFFVYGAGSSGEKKTWLQPVGFDVNSFVSFFFFLFVHEADLYVKVYLNDL